MSTPPPPKPWTVAKETGETARASTPAADGNAVKPWDAPGAGSTVTPPVATANNPTGTTATPPARNWEATYRDNRASTSGYGSGYGYGSGGYGSMYGSGYGSGYGGYGGGYGGYGGYGSGYGSMHGSGYGGYGSMYGGYGGYRGGMYGNSMYGGYGSMYGGGMYGGPPPMGPYGPEGPPPGAPPLTGWQAVMQSLSSVVHLFGKISFLVDENTQALHFFIMSLLQLLDRGGHLYGEMSRLILKAMGYPVPPRQPPPGFAGGPPGGSPFRGAPGAPSFNSAWDANAD